MTQREQARRKPENIMSREVFENLLRGSGRDDVLMGCAMAHHDALSAELTSALKSLQEQEDECETLEADNARLRKALDKANIWAGTLRGYMPSHGTYAEDMINLCESIQHVTAEALAGSPAVQPTEKETK